MQGKGKAAAKQDEPRKIGYKTFQSGKEAADYFRKLLLNITKNQDLNEVCVLCQALSAISAALYTCLLNPRAACSQT